MAKRTNWKIEFTNLVASKRLVGRDRTFIESLYRHWSSGKAMTSGRKHHFFLVKERIAQLEAGGVTGDATIEARCASMIERTAASSWDRGFVESLQGQNANGRSLSARQLDILVKIEERHSDEALASARGFADSYGTDERTTAIRMAKYYQGTPYYGDLVDRLLTDAEFVPTKKQYDAITGNKYATKVLQGYENPAMYLVGSTVQPRSGCHYVNVKLFKRGAIVISTTEAIKSACKGNRMYKILPIGGVKPLLVEERHIKVRR